MQQDEVDLLNRAVPLTPARIFCSLIYVPGFPLSPVLERLVSEWGDLEFVSTVSPFDFTRYYEKEMGEGLARKFVTFQRPVGQDALPGLKHTAMGNERHFCHAQGRRRVNIDPGLLTPDNLVLGTTKPCSHRPYLSSGIFADVTLIYQAKSYQPLPWTYPDYASQETIRMMNDLRGRHKLQEQVDRKDGFS